MSPRPHKLSNSGSVLLEVVLALVLFVAAATIITAGMNASVTAVQRLRFGTHALNLAHSTMAEIQMHARPMESAGPEPFPPPFDEWMWRVDVAALEASSVDADAMKKVEVTIWHATENSVQRLAQIMRSDDIATSPDAANNFSTNYFSPTPPR